MSLNIIVAVLCIGLAGWLIWVDYRRTRIHRAIRAIATTIAVSCLYLLFDTLSENLTGPSIAASPEIILMTRGTSEDSVKNFLRSHPDTRVFAADAELLSNTNLNASAIDWSIISPRNSSSSSSSAAAASQQTSQQSAQSSQPVKTINIFGHGLAEERLKLLNGVNINFYPTVLSNHFTDVSWPAKLAMGERLSIQGGFNNSGDRKLTLKLYGFDMPLDSFTLAPAVKSTFELSAYPKQKGRAIYTLVVFDGRDTQQIQKIPVETVEAEPLKILLLATSPDFENKFLKSWLFEGNYAVASRTAISKNKFNTELLNLPAVKPETIDAKLSGTTLNGFDLVIADATALQQLSSGELTNIKNAVNNDGLGLIVKADSITPPGLFFNRSFTLKQSAVTHKQEVKLTMTDTVAKLASLTVERPAYIGVAESSRGIVRDKEGHLYAAITNAGAGRILYTTLSNTHSWVLSGDTSVYRGLWSDLISQASKKKLVNEEISVPATFAAVDMPVDLQVLANDTVAFSTRVNGSVLPMTQNLLLPFYWNATYWPRKSGWQYAFTRENKAFSWYTFRDNEWNDIRASESIAINVKYALTNDITKEPSKDADSVLTTTTKRMLLIIMFILCCTYLWIEEKFSNAG